MNLEVELLKAYSCTDLDSLLECSARAFETVGLPYVILKWTPAPASEAVMISHSLPVWNNFSERLGMQGDALSHSIGESIGDGLRRAKCNTRDRQAWKCQQSRTFLVATDAPKDFLLTQIQRRLICDFGQRPWREIISHPLCKERDRFLVLEAKTQDRVTPDMVIAARRIFTVFQGLYRSFHSSGAMDFIPHAPTEAPRELSRREIECLQWLAAGKTLQEAATILDISERTLRFHISNARKSLGVATTMQAVVAAALQYGFNPKDARRSIYSISRAPLPSMKLKEG